MLRLILERRTCPSKFRMLRERRSDLRNCGEHTCAVPSLTGGVVFFLLFFFGRALLRNGASKTEQNRTVHRIRTVPARFFSSGFLPVLSQSCLPRPARSRSRTGLFALTNVDPHSPYFESHRSTEYAHGFLSVSKEGRPGESTV